MGVTIHISGKLKSEIEFSAVIEIAREFAVDNEMVYNLFDEPIKTLERVKNGKDWDYVGPTKGIRIQPDENSDPLWLEFDKDYFIQEYCKTQFANIEIHIEIIKLLKKIEPYFEQLNIIDEGEYWESFNHSILQVHIDNCFTAIEEAKKENSKLSGPFRVKGNRIVDLMVKE